MSPSIASPVSPRDRHAIAVLGGGLAGLAAAQHLVRMGHHVSVFEKNTYLGGHASTHNLQGFLFDEGPHVSFTKRPEIQELLAAGVEGEYLEHKAGVVNFWRGKLIPHPAQCHLHGLPVDLIERCLVDFARAQVETTEIAHYGDWCRRSLGGAFSEEFTFRYTRKYWTVEAHQLSTDWVGSRVFSPSLDQVVRGALSPQKPSTHYITQFRYPKTGGFASYVRAVLPEGGDVQLGCAVDRIDLRARRLEFANGRRAEFDLLVSSLPLPELIRRIDDVPVAVRDAADRLACTSVALVNLGLERDQGFPDCHWAYVYDEDAATSRLHFPHRLSPNNAPPGCGSVQAEVYYSRTRPLPTRDLIDHVVEDLTKLRILKKYDRIAVAQQQIVPYANVLFDHERAPNLAVVQGWLAEQGVICCGRYGEWAYLWSDDSILSGWRAAERAATALVRPRRMDSNGLAA
jgi:protoporphyrinogen oxidase